MTDISNKVTKSKTTPIPEKENSFSPKKMVTIESHCMSSPFMPPDLLKQYDEIKPGIGQEMLGIAIKSINHQIEMEKEVIISNHRIAIKGQIFAFIISMLGLMGAIICAHINQVTIGSVIGGATLISLVPNFISGYQKKVSKKK